MTIASSSNSKATSWTRSSETACRDLHMITGRMKFLGSYPVPGGTPSDFRVQVEAERRLADDWLAERRASVKRE